MTQERVGEREVLDRFFTQAFWGELAFPISAIATDRLPPIQELRETVGEVRHRRVGVPAKMHAQQREHLVVARRSLRSMPSRRERALHEPGARALEPA